MANSHPRPSCTFKLDCKTTLLFCPKRIRHGMVIFKKSSWDLLGHCDSASSCLAMMWPWIGGGGATTSPASPRTAPDWSRCVQWCWPAPGCPWARSGHCLPAFTEAQVGWVLGRFLLSRWASQPSPCCHHESTFIHKCLLGLGQQWLNFCRDLLIWHSPAIVPELLPRLWGRFLVFVPFDSPGLCKMYPKPASCMHKHNREVNSGTTNSSAGLSRSSGSIDFAQLIW